MPLQHFCFISKKNCFLVVSNWLKFYVCLVSRSHSSLQLFKFKALGSKYFRLGSKKSIFHKLDLYLLLRSKKIKKKNWLNIIYYIMHHVLEMHWQNNQPCRTIWVVLFWMDLDSLVEFLQGAYCLLVDTARPIYWQCDCTQSTPLGLMTQWPSCIWYMLITQMIPPNTR